MTASLITLEGIDGSGKSTLWKNLKHFYKDKDEYGDILFTREPTQDTWYGDTVYNSINQDDANELAELFLYLADHANHLQETILPALENNTTVICDRYIDSRIAYQAATLNNNSDISLDTIDEMHQPWSYYPDKTLYLDVPASVGAKRSGETNKFEQKHYLEIVSQHSAILSCEYPKRYARIDAEKSKEHVFERAIEEISYTLNNG